MLEPQKATQIIDQINTEVENIDEWLKMLRDLSQTDDEYVRILDCLDHLNLLKSSFTRLMLLDMPLERPH